MSHRGTKSAFFSKRIIAYPFGIVSQNSKVN